MADKYVVQSLTEDDDVLAVVNGLRTEVGINVLGAYVKQQQSLVNTSALTAGLATKQNTLTTGATGLAILAAGTQNEAQTALGASAGLTPNLLRNSSFTNWPRGTSVAVAASSDTLSASSVCPMWGRLTGANQAVTVAQVAAPSGSKTVYGVRNRRNSGQTGTGRTSFQRTFSTEEIAGMRGQKLAVRFSALAGANFSPTSGTVTCYLYSGTGSEARAPVGGYTTGNVTLGSVAGNLTTNMADFNFLSDTVPTNCTQLALAFEWTPVGTAGAADDWTLVAPCMRFATVASGEYLPDTPGDLSEQARWMQACGNNWTARNINASTTNAILWGALKAAPRIAPTTSLAQSRVDILVGAVPYSAPSATVVGVSVDGSTSRADIGGFTGLTSATGYCIGNNFVGEVILFNAGVW